MTLDRAIENEEARIKKYEMDSRFLAMYGSFDRSREKAQMAEDHKQYVEWFKQLRSCENVYKYYKKELKENKGETALDSAEKKKAYTIVQVLKEVFEDKL